jgi:hypothetical protein
VILEDGGKDNIADLEQLGWGLGMEMGWDWETVRLRVTGIDAAVWSDVREDIREYYWGVIHKKQHTSHLEQQLARPHGDPRFALEIAGWRESEESLIEMWTLAPEFPKLQHSKYVGGR